MVCFFFFFKLSGISLFLYVDVLSLKPSFLTDQNIYTLIFRVMLSLKEGGENEDIASSFVI